MSKFVFLSSRVTVQPNRSHFIILFSSFSAISSILDSNSFLKLIEGNVRDILIDF